MKVIDLNVLLYAVNRDSPHHAAAKNWLERTLNDGEPVALSWPVLLGFLRLTTSARIFARPLTIEEALSIVDGWLEFPSVILLNPGEDHWHVLRSLLVEAGTGGNLTTDAHLAAIAIENGAELCSTDTDFARFHKLRWTHPFR